MGSKINLLSTILLFTIFSCVGCLGQTKEDKKENKELINVKKFVFCNCLYETLPEKEKIKTEEGSSSHFLQSSNLPLEVFTESLDFLKKYLKNTEKDYINFYEKPNVGIVRCLDFYESKELDSFIKKVISEKTN